MAKFVKGQSGNPTGRPKQDNELKALAKTKTKEAFATLLELMADNEPSVRLGAAKVILEYGWGRPTQAVELSDAEGGPAILQIVQKADK